MKLKIDIRENTLYTNGKTAVIVNYVFFHHGNLSHTVDYSILNKPGSKQLSVNAFRKHYRHKVDRIEIVRE